MEQQEQEAGSKRFGAYLRRVRETRKLSLDAVEELCATLPGRVTKSHLSRIENGLAVPSFPRLFALGRIYGVPVAALAERFEIEIQREQAVARGQDGRPDEVVLEEADALRLSCRFSEALALYDALRERTEEAASADRALIRLALKRIDCLIHLDRYELAKEAAERLLGKEPIADEEHLIALAYFVVCCYRLKRYTVALMALDCAERLLEAPFAPKRLRADLAAIRGNILASTGQPGEAVPWYERALSEFEALADQLEICRTRLNLSSAFMDTGEHGRAEQQVRVAMTVAESSGLERQTAWALSNLAVLAFRRKDAAATEAHALRSNAIARPREYWSVVFRNCYYLREIAFARGDEAGVRANERTLRTYLTQVDDTLPEARAFRALLKDEGR